MITIRKVHAKARCAMTGKEGLCVEIVDGEEDAPVKISLNSLMQLIRMEAARDQARSTHKDGRRSRAAQTQQEAASGTADAAFSPQGE